MKRLLLFLMLLSLTFANMGQGGREPSEVILEQLQVIYSIVIPLMILMVMLAAAAYVIGNVLGAEYRAKSRIWAQGMLVAVGISAVVIIMLNVIVPGFMGGAVPFADVEGLIVDLRNLTQTILGALIILLILLSAVTYVIGQFLGAQDRANANVWATNLLSGAIVSAVVYVLLFQILTQFESSLFAGTPLAIYSGVVINVTFFVSFFILITYLLSKVFKIPEWEAYLNIEMSNLMSSFLIVIFIVGLFAAGSLVSISFGADPSPPKAAISYLREVVIESVLQGLRDVYFVQMCTSILNTISRRIGEFVLTQTYKVFPGVDTFVNITNVMAMGLVSAYASLSAQVALLYFVDAVMVNFFLPAGLILRFFPPTRDAGAFLISFAFGFQVIFPTTYLINRTIFEDIGATVYSTAEVRHVINSICGPFKFGVYGILLNTQINPIFGLVPGGNAVGGLLATLFSEGLLNYIAMGEFVVIMEQIAKLSLLALFIPALSMVVTIAFINAMTKFIVGKM